MTLITRCVDDSLNTYEIKELFIKFLQVDDTTGQGLFEVLENVLNSHDLDIDNVRGQGYDNGSNMKAISSLEKRFEQYELYESVFGFLFNSDKLHSKDDIKLQSCCINFENTLRKERSFSKLKLIKSYLRTTMSQERLNGFALMAIESDILEEVDTESLCPYCERSDEAVMSGKWYICRATVETVLQGGTLRPILGFSWPDSWNNMTCVPSS
ncbi:uncharacterized protein LOC120182624 [Hibiscus syriacus]|uniref:uncharacterized protein LOC120182624 n=1 Tax=Hibiscus syriacus TaxID=106335 RepID=UPI001924337C|nr:uncharacterized protein LOC120182624 [Hibiscus syriacus]